jgi:anti-sigma regulatory factor (Ser/Thr protein kinase)
MNSTARRFPARLACLTEVLIHMATICKQAGLKSIEKLRVELVVEELFTNTVHHGYGQDCDLPVWIAAYSSNGNLCITYQDAAPAYNPLTHVANKTPPSLGGLGVTLVQNMAQACYHHENGRNTLKLTFPPSPD